jgi:lipopolysaccharide transport system ATP-binding protein
MSETVIKVENLSKQYRIGSRERYKTFRETLLDAVKSPFLGISSISPKSETIWALKDVFFEVKHGEIIGIIGRNGAGKTTLLKILSKITQPTTGRIELKGRVGSLLEVGIGFHPELTGHENVYLYGAILGMDRWEVTRKFDEIVAFAELEKFVDTPVKRYSSGMYMRLAFSVAAHLEPEILLVDEVLAVGDSAFQKKCLGKMENVSKEGRTVLFVSHNMSAVKHLCDSALLLVMGQIRHIGPTSETIELYEQDVLLSARKGPCPPHVIFHLDEEQNKPRSDFEIVCVETLDQYGRPKAVVSTWDRVKFRISYWARHDVQAGSAVLEVATRHGVPLLLCSTQPDSVVPMTIRAGKNSVECEFISLPLSAGEYIVGAGLAIPNKEWLCKRAQLGWLSIHPKDVYQSGMAPTASRSILATPHVWRVT